MIIDIRKKPPGTKELIDKLTAFENKSKAIDKLIKLIRIIYIPLVFVPIIALPIIFGWYSFMPTLFMGILSMEHFSVANKCGKDDDHGNTKTFMIVTAILLFLMGLTAV